MYYYIINYHLSKAHGINGKQIHGVFRVLASNQKDAISKLTSGYRKGDVSIDAVERTY